MAYTLAAHVKKPPVGGFFSLSQHQLNEPAEGQWGECRLRKDSKTGTQDVATIIAQAVEFACQRLDPRGKIYCKEPSSSCRSALKGAPRGSNLGRQDLEGFSVLGAHRGHCGACDKPATGTCRLAGFSESESPVGVGQSRQKDSQWSALKRLHRCSDASAPVSRERGLSLYGLSLPSPLNFSPASSLEEKGNSGSTLRSFRHRGEVGL